MVCYKIFQNYWHKDCYYWSHEIKSIYVNIASENFLSAISKSLESTVLLGKCPARSVSFFALIPSKI